MDVSKQNQHSFSSIITLWRSLALRYGIAIFSVVIALIITLTLQTIFMGAPFLLMWPAVVMSAWLGGFGPGILAAFLAALAINYFFDPPLYVFSGTTESLLQFGIFTGLAILISGFQETRQRSTDQLRKQQEWLSVTLASIGDGVIATDERGCILFMNPVAAALTGWQQEEVIGKDITQVFNIIYEDTRQPVKIPLIRALEQGVIVGLANHTLLITKDGREIPISDSGAPIRAANGTNIGAVLIFRDVTQERGAVIALEASEARYRDVVENAHDTIYALDLQGNLTSINPAGEQTFGYSRDELLGTPIARLIVPEYHERMQQMLQRKIVDGGSTTYELEMQTKDGRILTLEISSRLAFKDGVPVGIQGIARNITERKKTEQRNQLLQDFAAQLSAALTVSQVTEVIVRTAIKAVEGDFGAAFRLTDDQTALERLGSINIDQEYEQKYQQIPLDLHFPICDSVKNKQVLWIHSQQEYSRLYPQLEEDLKKVNVHGVICFPFLVNNVVIGVMHVSFMHPKKANTEELNLLLLLAQVCGQTLERVRLGEQAKKSVALEERQRLARDLHDSVNQALFSATAIAETAARSWAKDPLKAIEHIESVALLNRGAMAEMRTLLLELRPDSILNMRLVDLYQQLVDTVQGRKEIKINLLIEGNDVALPPDVHVAFYRIAQESMNNIVKHSQAPSGEITLRQQPDQVQLVVVDHGQGYDTNTIAAGMGLNSMHERAAAIGAILIIKSHPGDGTEINLTWQR